MRQKFTLITLGVHSIEHALDFYEKGLGWKRSPASTDNMIFLPLGGMVLGLYPRYLLAEDALLPGEGSGFSGITIACNAHSPEEVDSVLEEVGALGATIVKPAQKSSGVDTAVISKTPTATCSKWRITLSGS